MYSRKLAEQYAKLKAEAGANCVLLMQVGSFTQVQGEDARAVSTVTGLKLQMAGDVDAPVVLGGFPKSGLDAYVGKLVRAGKSVAIAMQDGDGLEGEPGVRRCRGLANGSAQPRPPADQSLPMEGERLASRDQGRCAA